MFVSVWMYAHKHRCPWSAEEGTEAPGAGVKAFAAL